MAMAESKKPRKKMELSDEERERRRQTAIELREKGVFGGKQKGAGRPRKRAQSQVVEGIREDGNKILVALRKALKSDNETVALKAALAMLEIENNEEKLVASEESRQYEKMAKDQLLEMITEKFNQMQSSGIDVQQFLIGKAKEIPPKKVINEENGSG